MNRWQIIGNPSDCTSARWYFTKPISSLRGGKGRELHICFLMLLLLKKSLLEKYDRPVLYLLTGSHSGCVLLNACLSFLNGYMGVSL